MSKRYLIREFILVLSLVVLLGFEKQIDRLMYDIMGFQRNPVQWTSLTDLMLNHMKLVLLSTLCALLITVSVVLLVHLMKLNALEELFGNLAGLGTTFPSVAVMALLVPIIGYGFVPVFLALSLYSFLPMYISMVSGLKAIDQSIIESAKGTGMSSFQLLYKIELPLAKRMIVSGIKTAVIINISSATIGSIVGSNTLGLPIVIGIRTTDMVMILKGALPVALLAFLAESILSRFEGVASWQKH
ncbi:MAG: ABC transporter permease [Clostridia bacterium]|nr:ABC transporter permease [Clostridia bacterium]